MIGQKKCAPDSTHRPVRTQRRATTKPACRRMPRRVAATRLGGVGERAAAAVGQVGGERQQFVAVLGGVHGAQPLLALLQGQPALGHRGAQDLRRPARARCRRSAAGWGRTRWRRWCSQALLLDGRRLTPESPVAAAGGVGSAEHPARRRRGARAARRRTPGAQAGSAAYARREYAVSALVAWMPGRPRVP